MSSKWWRIKVDWIITSHDRLLTRLIALHVVVSSFWTISTISAGLFLVNDDKTSPPWFLIIIDGTVPVYQCILVTKWSNCDATYKEDLLLLVSSSTLRSVTCPSKDENGPTNQSIHQQLQTLNKVLGKIFWKSTTCTELKLADCICQRTSNHLGPEEKTLHVL